MRVIKSDGQLYVMERYGGIAARALKIDFDATKTDGNIITLVFSADEVHFENLDKREGS